MHSDSCAGFPLLFAAFALVSAPVWVPVAFVAYMLKGVSLKDWNDAANAASGFDNNNKEELDDER